MPEETETEAPVGNVTSWPSANETAYTDPESAEKAGKALEAGKHSAEAHKGAQGA